MIVYRHLVRRAGLVASVVLSASLSAACDSGLSSATGRSPTSAIGGVIYRDAKFGWTIRHSKEMQVGHFAAGGMFTADGEWVANFDAGVSGKTSTCGGGVPNMCRFRTFPKTGVALLIWFGERIPFPPPLRDSRFPITLGALHAITPYVGGKEPVPQYGNVDGDGSSFAVAVWFGSRASASDRQAIAMTLESLRFPPLRSGTIRANRFYILDRVQSYPTGSVTHVAASTLPVSRPYFTDRHGFYLVHAPRDLYAIPDRFEYPNSKQSCSLAYDPASKQFSCPGTGLRWARDGTPVVSPDSNAGFGSNWALGLHVATVAHDGHVLYSPFFGALLGLRLKGNPWA